MISHDLCIAQYFDQKKSQKQVQVYKNAIFDLRTIKNQQDFERYQKMTEQRTAQVDIMIVVMVGTSPSLYFICKQQVDDIERDLLVKGFENAERNVPVTDGLYCTLRTLFDGRRENHIQIESVKWSHNMHWLMSILHAMHNFSQYF